jgi:transcriptional regulator with XRE-family HTH domain
MPPRIGQEQALQRIYLREWREDRGLSQDRLVSRMLERLAEFSKSSLSRIENGHQPYSQPILEAAAWALNCEPADILRPLPTPPDEFSTFVMNLDAKKRQRALQILKAALDDEAA